MTRASAHRAPSRRAAASATTVLRSALGALLVSRRRRSALLCARAFQLLGFFLALFELGHVHIFFKAWNFALFFFDLFFFNHPASLRAAILRSVTCGKP